MRITHLRAAEPYDADHFVAEELMSSSQCNVRMIRLMSGQVLPPHRHAPSELVLFVVEGEATISGSDGDVLLPAGALVAVSGDEELRLSNTGFGGTTLLAFLAPPFPPAANG
jgi:quercetin dioxygenase-like cupin family protein